MLYFWVDVQRLDVPERRKPVPVLLHRRRDGGWSQLPHKGPGRHRTLVSSAGREGTAVTPAQPLEQRGAGAGGEARLERREQLRKPLREECNHVLVPRPEQQSAARSGEQLGIGCILGTHQRRVGQHVLVHALVAHRRLPRRVPPSLRTARLGRRRVAPAKGVVGGDEGVEWVALVEENVPSPRAVPAQEAHGGAHLARQPEGAPHQPSRRRAARPARAGGGRRKPRAHKGGALAPASVSPPVEPLLHLEVATARRSALAPVLWPV
mmetsp:Transcript_30561/g.91076  ORF Transcript_30561/g.91076 Transcript_30561/m.91076 type:complete len:266 (+) Transcript_30561:3-800(+)